MGKEGYKDLVNGGWTYIVEERKWLAEKSVFNWRTTEKLKKILSGELIK